MNIVYIQDDDFTGCDCFVICVGCVDIFNTAKEVFLVHILLLGDFFLLKFPTCFFFSFRDLFNDWTIELKAMADRIISMRQELFDALCSRGQRLQSSFYNSFSFVFVDGSVSFFFLFYAFHF